MKMWTYFTLGLLAALGAGGFFLATSESNNPVVQGLQSRVEKLPFFPANVRRQGFWVHVRPKLRERLAHLIGIIMRRVACDASVALRVSFV